MKEQANSLVTDLKALMGNHKGFVAVGIDVAALEDNWGICVLLIEDDLIQASLSLLLPQAKSKKDGTPHATNYCRPSFAILKMILEAISENELPGSMGVDVPFGWPVEHKRFVNNWSAAEGWQAAEGIPERSGFEKRWCDIALNEYERTIAPFVPSAHASAAAAPGVAPDTTSTWAREAASIGSRKRPIGSTRP